MDVPLFVAGGASSSFYILLISIPHHDEFRPICGYRLIVRFVFVVFEEGAEDSEREGWLRRG